MRKYHQLTSGERYELELINAATRTVRTITVDHGTEFHGYKDIERATGSRFYFATPYHSWERGTSENTNGLIRQYFPKGVRAWPTSHRPTAIASPVASTSGPVNGSTSAHPRSVMYNHLYEPLACCTSHLNSSGAHAHTPDAAGAKGAMELRRTNHSATTRFGTQHNHAIAGYASPKGMPTTWLKGK